MIRASMRPGSRNGGLPYANDKLRRKMHPDTRHALAVAGAALLLLVLGVWALVHHVRAGKHPPPMSLHNELGKWKAPQVHDVHDSLLNANHAANHHQQHDQHHFHQPEDHMIDGHHPYHDSHDQYLHPQHGNHHVGDDYPGEPAHYAADYQVRHDHFHADHQYQGQVHDPYQDHNNQHDHHIYQHDHAQHHDDRHYHHAHH